LKVEIEIEVTLPAVVDPGSGYFDRLDLVFIRISSTLVRDYFDAASVTTEELRNNTRRRTIAFPNKLKRIQ
jgi:hypothetical protein